MFDPKKWAGRVFECSVTGERLKITDDVRAKAFYLFGDAFIDVGDGYYSRSGGKFIEIKEGDHGNR